ncbi:hypothetical protein [Cytobacillus sp. IB215665]|uniref:YncE family protein n=1 Tax=Cytobacillus sp. IB215665 TaxID=3097357 RepID=UPI002A0EC7D0|nr:hypothetical protein [Cytobacillus sp. IB215665]MDX8366728.1 hypothetical protein [Cytobacillus sp. IB215665]
MSVIDTKTHWVIATIQVEVVPVDIIFTPDSKLAYIVIEVDDNVSVIELQALNMGDTIEVQIQTANLSAGSGYNIPVLDIIRYT